MVWLPLAYFPPMIHSFPPGTRPSSPCVHLSARFPERIWAGPTLNCHLLQGKQRPVPPPFTQPTGNRASPFYVFRKFPNMPLSVAAFAVVYLFRVLASKHLFVVNCKTGNPLKLFFLKKESSSFTGNFSCGKTSPCPVERCPHPRFGLIGGAWPSTTEQKLTAQMSR